MRVYASQVVACGLAVDSAHMLAGHDAAPVATRQSPLGWQVKGIVVTERERSDLSSLELSLPNACDNVCHILAIKGYCHTLASMSSIDNICSLRYHRDE